MLKKIYKLKQLNLGPIKLGVFYFLFYGFLGWIIDSSYSSIVNNKIIFGGMFKSFLLPIPFAPIYSFGALSLIILQKFLSKQNIILKIILPGLILILIEYLGGYITEFLFNHRAWDYSQNFANLNGHIDLWHSFLWIILGLLFLKIIHPITRFCLNKFLKK